MLLESGSDGRFMGPEYRCAALGRETAQTVRHVDTRIDTWTIGHVDTCIDTWTVGHVDTRTVGRQTAWPVRQLDTWPFDRQQQMVLWLSVSGQQETDR